MPYWTEFAALLIWRQAGWKEHIFFHLLPVLLDESANWKSPAIVLRSGCVMRAFPVRHLSAR